MKMFIRKKSFYIPVAVVVVILIAFVSLRKEKALYTFVSVERKDIVQEVSVTGKVKPVESVSLSFEQGGRVASVVADVGDKVSLWQGLVYLDTTAAQLNLAQEEARLEELRLGTRPEDFAILDSKLSAAQSKYALSRQAAADALQEAYTSADDAIHNYADQFFDNARTSSPQLNVTVSDDQLRINLINGRIPLEALLSDWHLAVSSVTSHSDLTSLIELSRSNLEKVKDLLDKLALAVNSLTPSQGLSATTIATYRSNISTARSAVNAALANLTADETALSSASSDVDLAQKNLDLAKAGTLPEQIAAQQAKVDSIKHTLAVSVLRTPIAGTVTKQDAKVGQVVKANEAVTSVISENKLEIEAYVPEVDIGSMAVGNKTEITFDAFPGESFEGTVSYIDPAETVIDGVPTYRIKLSMEKTDARVRSGMTANLSVVVAEKSQALTLPYRAIAGQSGSRHVLIKEADGSVRETPVDIGIRGITGEVEVVSGLEEGQEIAIPN